MILRSPYKEEEEEEEEVPLFIKLSEVQAIGDEFGHDFYQSVGAFVNTFESRRQSVFCFQVKIAS